MREEYYDRRAPEYDDAYLGHDIWTPAEVDKIVGAVRSLPSADTLDVACGTGFLTRYLSGRVVACDFSMGMLRVARREGRVRTLVRASAFALPFHDDSVERVFSSHFYGRLEPDERALFRAEARRVGRKLVIVDTPFQDGRPAEGQEERVLSDGSRFTIYKRYFRPQELLDELGGGEVFHDGDWFLGVVSGP